MLVPELSNEIVNKLFSDPFGKTNALLAVNKPVGSTSHDIVDIVRKILRTRKVGHAGALDPFASGVLLLLVGKFTKYTEAVIGLDKQYRADIGLGLKTLTQDPEGEILAQESSNLDIADLNVLQSQLQNKFMPGYDQVVPVFSSVKVQGHKLRVLARNAKSIKKISNAEVKFEQPDGTELIVELPVKHVKINELVLENISKIRTLPAQNFQSISGDFQNLSILVSVSKGTYIRQLAEDIGEHFNLPAYLSKLQRTKVGQFGLENAIDLDVLADIAIESQIISKADKHSILD